MSKLAKRDRVRATSFDTMIARMAEIKAISDRVTGYHRPKEIVDAWIKATDLLREGHNGDAAEKAQGAIDHAKNSLSAFLREAGPERFEPYVWENQHDFDL